MKKHHLLIAILLVVAAVSVAVVSCKKEDTKTLSTNNVKEAFDPRQIEDMNAYLKDFKNKMQLATKGEDEAFSLDEAAWHLSNMANYDFGYVNVEFTDLRYDTLYYHVNITDGKVLLSDLNTVYMSISNDIVHLSQTLNLQEKHIRYVKAFISENGMASVQVITSYINSIRTWHLDDFYIDTICDYFFSDDSVYVWNALGASELERVANLMEGRNYVMSIDELSGRAYFVYTMTQIYDFRYYTDPYGSAFLNNSRIYAVFDETYATPELSKQEMCYCLDSYLGLPFESISTPPYFQDQRPVFWDVRGYRHLFPNNRFYTYYHEIAVDFGLIIGTPDNPING